MKIETFEQVRQNEQRLPGILHLERGRGMSRLRLLARSDCSGLKFHPGDETIKNKPNEVSSLFFPLFIKNIRHLSQLTRSKTRENSGVLRVFKGSAGLRVNCSSVRGGTCLMKKYLQTEKQKKTP